MRLVPAGIIRVDRTRTPAHILQGLLVSKMRLLLLPMLTNMRVGFCRKIFLELRCREVTGHDFRADSWL